MPGSVPQVGGVAGAYQWHTRSAIKTLSTGAALLGVAMAAGGAARFGSPGLAAARSMPGAQLTWGALFLAAGLLAWAGIALSWHRRTVMAGVALQTFLHAFFAIGLVVSAARDSRAALTGCVVYTMAAVLCASTWATGYGLGRRP